MPLSNSTPVLAGVGITKTGYTLAVDQSFTPTWTGLHKFNAGIGGDSNLTLQPTGDIVLDPTGNDVLPGTGYDVNLGSLAKKFLTLHAAELWVETLVAQNTIATIGGRILVGPTTTLTRDVGTGDTTIYVKHNQMTSGDRAYLEANGSVEFLAITSAPTEQPEGDYAYTVTRNLDGTGANQWYSGDACFNTGQAGSGFIDLYSLSSVKGASQPGPAIVGNVRNSATFNDWSEHWAIGNLNGLYGYVADIYGFAAGKYATGMPWISVDATNGLRINRGTTPTVLGQWDTSGVVTIGPTSDEHVRIDGTSVQIKDGATVYTDLTAGALTLGDTGNEHVVINASGIQLKDGASIYGVFAATTTIGPTASEHIAISGTSVQIKDGSTVYTDLTAGALLLGQVGSGQSNVYLTSGGVQLRTNTTVKVNLESDGDVFIGSNVSAAATTALAILSNDQTYNSEALGAGDLLLGDNSASKANILWDKSAGQLLFRGGQTTVLYVDTDGSMKAASGTVTINANGIQITPGMSAYLAIGNTPAQSGFIRIDNGQAIVARNNGNTGDVDIIKLTALDQIQIGPGGCLVTATAAIIANTLSLGSAYASSGLIRLPNGQGVAGRNSTNSADINIIAVNASDQIEIGGTLKVVGSGIVMTSGAGANKVLTSDANGVGTWQASSAGITQLTNDVTAGPGSGSQAATIAVGAVTLAKMANLAANSIIGNNTGGSATPLALSASQVKSLLAIASGDVSGLGTLATGYTASYVALGSNPAASGYLRVGMGQWMAGRNATNTADLNMFAINGDDQIEVGTAMKPTAAIVSTSTIQCTTITATTGKAANTVLKGDANGLGAWGQIVADEITDATITSAKFAAGAAYKKLSETTADGTTGTVTFWGINSSYRHLLVTVHGRSSNASTSVELRLRLGNGSVDTGSNYNDQVIIAVGAATPTLAEAQGATYIRVGNLPGSSATASMAGSAEAKILDYAGTTFFKNVIGQNANFTGTTASTGQYAAGGGIWKSTSAVDYVSVLLSAGNFVSGSKITLYGIPA